MRFLEIKDGFSINSEQIEAIEKVDDFTCKIYTHFNSYTANFPYVTILHILEEVVEPEDKNKVMEKFNAVLENAGHFAG